MELERLGDGTTILTVATRPVVDGRKQVARLVLSTQFAAGYRVDRELGAGAMGAVYAGTQLATGRTVAIKFLLAIGEADAAARFAREARLLAKISHPAVLRVIDVGELSGHPFLVTEMLPGGSLRQRITREVRLAPAVATRIAARVLEGLEACHAAHVVHRDLKPDNVMFDEHDQAVVVDLGIARLVDEAHSLTRTGATIGTPRYMAPEAWAGETVGPPADLFAVGAMLYECIAGRHPFEAATTPAHLLQLLAEGPPPLAEAARVPPGLAALVHRALSWSPAARPASAAAMRAELTAAGTHKSGAIRRPISRATAIPAAPARKPRGAIAGAVGLVLLGAVGLRAARTPGAGGVEASAGPARPERPGVSASFAVSGPGAGDTADLPGGARLRIGAKGKRRVLAVAPAADRLLVSDADGAYLVDPRTGAAVPIAPAPTRPIERAVFAPDGRRLALVDGWPAPGGQTTRSIVDTDTGAVAFKWSAPTMHSWLVQLGPAGLFETSHEESAIWDPTTGKRTWHVVLSTSATDAITLDPTFSHFCRSSPLLWDIADRDTMAQQAAMLRAIDLAVDGRRGARDKLVAMPHSFTPDGRFVIVDDREKKLLLFVQVRGCKTVQKFPHESASWLDATAVSPDGTRLAGAYHDGTLAVWELPSGHLRHRFRTPGEPGAQLGLDAARLISVGEGGTALVFDLVDPITR